LFATIKLQSSSSNGGHRIEMHQPDLCKKLTGSACNKKIQETMNNIIAFPLYLCCVTEHVTNTLLFISIKEKHMERLENFEALQE
jgi:hypothetical protein